MMYQIVNMMYTINGHDVNINEHAVQYVNTHDVPTGVQWGWAVHRSTDLGPLYHVYECGQFGTITPKLPIFSSRDPGK